MTQTLTEAQTIITEAISTFDQQDKDSQAQLKQFVESMRAQLILFDEGERLRDKVKRAAKTNTAQERKKVRDAEIPKWCRANLKVGMIVKVKASSYFKYRRIEEITGGYFVGRHCSPVRRLNKETGKRYHAWTDGNYITDHVYTNVQGVWMDRTDDERGQLVPIMELIENE